MNEEIVVETVVTPVEGEVIADIGNMTMEQFHIISMAPDFNENKVLQNIAAKWKLAHLPQE